MEAKPVTIYLFMTTTLVQLIKQSGLAQSKL